MGRRRERTLATVMFTDIVGSTELAAELGDRGWQELLARHHAIVRRNLKRFGGREVDTAGDGFFATFSRPTDAVRCACSIAADVRALGIEIRAGVHTGEVESGQAGVRGIAVHVGARVMGAATAGEVLVSSTVRDLVAGSGLELADHGVRRLKGVDEEWRLFALTAVDGERLGSPLDPAEAARRRAAIEPSSRPRRLGLVVAGATVLVALLATWVVVSRDGGRGEGPVGSTGPEANSVISFDPETGRIGHRVPLAVDPSPGGRTRVAVEGGEVWVRSVDLVHVDGPTQEIVDRYSDFVCCAAGQSQSLVIGSRTVWVPVGAGDVQSSGAVHRFDPASGDELETIRLRRRSAPSDVALGLDSLWIAFRDGSVERRDPFTGKLVDAFGVSARLDGIVLAGETLWVLDQFASEAIRIDPATGAELVRISLGGNPRMLAADDRRVWVLDPDASTVTPIFTSSDRASSSIGPLGEQPTGLAVGLDALWISNADGSLYRVDPADGRIDAVEVGVPLDAIAIDEDAGLLWLAVGD